MKRTLSVMLALLMSLIFMTFVSTANAETNSSVESNSAPTINNASVNGVDVTVEVMSIEFATNQKNNEVASFLINAKDELEQAKYKDSKAVDYKKIDANLDDKLTELAKELDASYTSNVFIPEQIFELSIEDGILTGNNKVKVVFDIETTDGKYVVIHKDKTQNKWLVVPKQDVTVENGKLAVSFSSLCPVALLTVNPDAIINDAPNPNVFTYALIGACALLIFLAFVLTFAPKNKKKNKTM